MKILWKALIGEKIVAELAKGLNTLIPWIILLYKCQKAMIQ